MYMICMAINCFRIPLASPFPIMDYIPDLSLVKNPKPSNARASHLLGAEALNPVIVKRLECCVKRL